MLSAEQQGGAVTALHSQVQALVDRLAASGRKPSYLGTVEQARENSSRMKAALGPPLPMARVSDFAIPGRDQLIAARLCVPHGQLQALLVYSHGGGWILGSIDDGHTAATHLADATRCAVLSIDYRLSPEHRFPAALHDVIDAVVWASRHRELLGIGELPLVIAGESAGANLSAAAASEISRRDPHLLAALVLVCPVMDAARDTPSHAEFEHGPLVSSRAVEWYWGHYLANPADGQSPLASPLRADSFASLPPTLVMTAESDPLRDEGELYAAKLEAAGVRAITHRCIGMCHGFFSLVNMLDGASQAMHLIGSLLPRLLENRAATSVDARTRAP